MTKGSALSNIDRIAAEIQRHAEEIAQEHGVPAHDLTRLCLDIVDLEDQHRRKRNHRVRQMMKDKIQNLSQAHSLGGGA